MYNDARAKQEIWLQTPVRAVGQVTFSTLCLPLHPFMTKSVKLILDSRRWYSLLNHSIYGIIRQLLISYEGEINHLMYKYRIASQLSQRIIESLVNQTNLFAEKVRMAANPLGWPATLVDFLHFLLSRYIIIVSLLVKSLISGMILCFT